MRKLVFHRSRATWTASAACGSASPERVGEKTKAVSPPLSPFMANGWTLIDYVECDGRRYALAVDNGAPRPGLELLSNRERDVLHCALRGRHPKAIATELGIAYSTVRVLMARAMVKMGKGTWKEVLQAPEVTIGLGVDANH